MKSSPGAKRAHHHHTWFRSEMRCVETTAESSSRGAIVVPQQSGEESPAADAADRRDVVNCMFLRWTCRRSGHCPVAEPLVGAMFVEKTNVLLADVVEMTQVEAQEVI